MKEIILYGASGHAKVILEILEAAGYNAFTLWDDAVKPDLWHLPVQKPAAQIPAGSELIITIGSNRIRKMLALRYEGRAGFITAVHPRSILSSRAVIGAGTVCMAGVTINADAVAGSHCIINTNASIDHDCRLGDYVHISPNVALCGDVTVGEGTHIGAGAVVIPGIRIGAWCTVGAGAVVTRDIPDFATSVGNPSKTIKINNQ